MQTDTPLSTCVWRRDVQLPAHLHHCISGNCSLFVNYIVIYWERKCAYLKFDIWKACYFSSKPSKHDSSKKKRKRYEHICILESARLQIKQKQRHCLERWPLLSRTGYKHITHSVVCRLALLHTITGHIWLS